MPRLTFSALLQSLLSLLGAGLLLLGLAWPVWADVAPPEQAPGSSLGPPEVTQVRMVAEEVVLDIRPRELSGSRWGLAHRFAEAQVKATFLMRNLGQADEQMQVRFPLEAPTGHGDVAGVQGFSVRVAGQPVATTTILGELPSANQMMTWAAFPVLFPAGQDVTIEVSYLTLPTGYAPAGRFSYLLETGAGWAGTIGSVDVIARLPYPATEENVLLGPDRTNSGESYRTTPGEQFDGQEVRWHWDNLEPTRESNVYVNILLPYAWQQIQAAQAAVDARPDDVEALVALAEAYHNAITNDFPTESNDPFAAKSEQLYAQAVALRPNSVELHTRLAELMWDHLVVQAALPPDDPSLRPILEQLGQALLLDPQYGPALALLTQIENGTTGPVVLPNAPQTLPLSGGSGTLYPAGLFLLLGLASLGAGLAGLKKGQRLLAQPGRILGIPRKPVG